MRLMRRGGDGSAATPGSGAPGWARAVAGTVPGCQPVGDCRPRTQARVAGVVGSIKVVPRPDVTRLEITISDGTGEISGVWFGHHRIGGLDLGQLVVFEGMVGNPAPGRLEILHPTYQLLGTPAAR
jgi:RecG-like helicase